MSATALHLAGDVTYDADEATAVVVGYCAGREDIRLASAARRRRPPEGMRLGDPGDKPAFAYAFYDAVPRCVPEGHDPRLAYPADVAVANALNARMTGRQIAQLVGALPEVNRHLAGIPEAFTFLDADTDALASWEAATGPVRAMHAAWWAAARLDGIGTARANKLLHRVRPEVFPLYDNLTGPLLRPEPWAAVRDDLDRNTDAFARLRDRAGAHPAMPGTDAPGLLRLHDILLWCHAAERREYAAKLGRGL